MNDQQPPTSLIPISENRAIADTRFQELADIPPEAEWFNNISNPRTRRAYRIDVTDFFGFIGIKELIEVRQVSRSHVIAWRDLLSNNGASPATIRRKLSAVASLFDYLCDKNAVETNPVDGVKRPMADNNEGKTPAISDAQAKKLLNAPDPKTKKGIRDRAILATFLYHGLRVQELCSLKVGDIQERRGVVHFRIHGKRSKLRYVPVHPEALTRIHDYLAVGGHIDEKPSPLFRPVRNLITHTLDRHLNTSSVFRLVRKYGIQVGIGSSPFSPHSLRATSATNALEHSADIAKVQQWLGHANVSTTRLYDRRKSRPEESPTFQIQY